MGLVDVITQRILAEHKKHASYSGDEWARFAAIKIISEIELPCPRCKSQTRSIVNVMCNCKFKEMIAERQKREHN